MNKYFPSSKLFRQAIVTASASIFLLNGVNAESKLTQENLTLLAKEISLVRESQKLPSQDFSSWKKLLDDGQLATLQEQLAYYKQFPIAVELIAEINAQKEKEELVIVKDLEATYEENIKQITTAIDTAKSASDLDASLKLLSDAKNQLSSHKSNYSRKLLVATASRMDQHYRSATQIVASWQDYLNFHSSGNNSSAKSSLNSIASKLVNYPIIPRSKVLKLQEELNNPNVASIKISKLDEIISKFVKGLSLQETHTLLENTALEKHQRTQANTLILQIEPLLKLEDQDYKVTTAELIGIYKKLHNSNKRSDQRIAKIYSQHIAKAFEKELSFKSANKNTSLAVYLEAAIAHFISKEQWLEAELAMDYLSSLQNSNYSQSTRNLTNCLKHMKDGDSSLKADSWVGAIDSYRQGINASTPQIPRSLFVRKLAEMKKLDEKRFKKSSEIADDLTSQHGHERAAGVIWRLNQYILSNRFGKDRSAQPIPHHLQETIEKFVELEVDKRIKSLQPPATK